MQTVLYKRATFVTSLPTEHLYTPSHNWIARAGEEGLWRVGYTKFALRMLGELVDVRLDSAANAPIQPGDVLGSIEGFKAISDIYSVGEGQFHNGNPAFLQGLEAIAQKPYADGWLYEFRGRPDARAMNIDSYRSLLDVTIDRILEKQRQEESDK